jgi:ferredoxin
MGHGRCYQLAPGLLTCDDEGYVTIRDQVIDVPDDQGAAAEEAAGTCPEEAITLLRDRAHRPVSAPPRGPAP